MNNATKRYPIIFFLLNTVKIILIALKDFICEPTYWGYETGTPTKEMANYFKVTAAYNLYIGKIVIPLLNILIIYILSKILYTLLNKK